MIRRSLVSVAVASSIIHVMATISEALAIAIQHHQAGRLQAAEQIYRRILAVAPNHADAIHLLGVLAHQAGQHETAIQYIRRAIGLNDRSAAFHVNLGVALKDLGRLDEAVAAYRRAVELKPDFAAAYSNLGHALMDQGKLDEAAACCRRAVELQPESAEMHSNLLYALIFSPGYDAQALLAEHRRWDERHAVPLARFIPPHRHDRTPDRRLKIGYVSPDFRDHCQALFTVPLFSAHDHENFEIICYADVMRPDGVTARLRSLADQWRNITGLSHERVADLIRQDGIDVLVDLTMHMARNRLLVFARKPAPVQTCWLAYPGTTGLAAIDYRITDPYLDPPDVQQVGNLPHEEPYSEESIRLPDTFWCYDPLDSPAAVNALPAAERGYVTFGCLNNFCKVNPRVLNIWAQVLKAVAGSRLTILADEGTPRRHALDRLAAEGVGRERVTFVARQPRPQYLRQYQGIDIGLDTVPYNGHTTSLDSFWMGVPVVTLIGPTVVGRAGLSQLMNLGLPELIAASPEQYVQIVAELAGDLPRLSALRATLRERMRASPLMDAPRFARNIEAAYRAMWCSTAYRLASPRR